MAERMADRVTVPDVVGMPFHIGRDVASAAGVTLANPDPDGPPIGALAWPGLFYITSQQPPAGTDLYRWDSVIIEIVEHGTAESNALRPNIESPPKDSAHAAPERELFVDLTESEPQPGP
ncbi:PASTA domain-containing protein [Microbacterium sp. HA-8]|uniref:PASTA domain-containing protein n=1 Tax=Microbacterium sp. HA-8 TaxID=3234200 RepID=UPI0038F70422